MSELNDEMFTPLLQGDIRDAVWVIVRDLGYEGLSEPMMAFKTEATANDCRELLQADPASSSVRVIKVPLWKHP
jgi:hypothetical protein